MTLPLELGGIRDPALRRAFEQIAQQFPVVPTGGGGGGGAPSGPAGGVLSGTYPNPGFAADMATQAELDSHAGLTTTAHGGIVASSDARLTDARTPTAHKATHEPGGSDALTGLTNASIAAAAGIAKTKLANLDVVNADVNVAAAIARSKLDFGSGLVNADISATAAIAKTKLAALTIVDADVSATAAIAESKLSLATDAAAGTGSRRTLGTSATSAAAGNRGLPTGGATGQALTKNSATDYDAGWSTISSGGSGVTQSPWIAVVSQAADVTNATTSNVNTDLVFNFDANSTYIIDLYLMTTSAATTTGVAFAWDTSVAVTNANLTFEHQLATTGTLTGGDAIADDTVRGLSSGTPDTGVTPVIGMGLIRTSTNAGTARLRFRPEVAASATFKAGSVMRVMKVGGTASGIPLVSSLPGSPVDAQEIYYQDSTLAATGRRWHFAYRSGSSLSNKWEFLGGRDLVAPAGANVGPVAMSVTGAYTAITGMSSITVPLAGVYDLHYGASILQPNNATMAAAFIYYSGAAQGPGARYGTVNAAGATDYVSVSQVMSEVALTASLVVELRYFTQGGGTIYAPWMRLVPVRV